MTILSAPRAMTGSQAPEYFLHTTPQGRLGLSSKGTLRYAPEPHVCHLGLRLLRGQPPSLHSDKAGTAELITTGPVLIIMEADSMWIAGESCVVYLATEHIQEGVLASCGPSFTD